MRLSIIQFLLGLLVCVAILMLCLQLRSVSTNLGRSGVLNQNTDRSAFKRINITSIEFLYRSSICLFKKPKIIVLVTSHASNIYNRNVIRRSYPKDLFDKFNAHLIFLLAVAPTNNETFDYITDKELKEYDDIVQGTFMESYRNLTLKHLMGFKWTSEFCRSVEYVVKMDDDIVVNYYKLFQLIKTYRFELMGHVLDHMKPIRDSQNKWFVSRKEYENENYPEFLSGWLYVATFDSVLSLLNQAHLAKFFWIDDLLVTGILREKAKLKLTDIRQYFRYEPKNIECCISNKYSCDFLAAPNGKDFNLTKKFYNHLWECRYKKICSLESNKGTSCWWSETLAVEQFIKFKENRYQLIT